MSALTVTQRRITRARMVRTSRYWAPPAALALVAGFLVAMNITPTALAAPSTGLVISEVYGGGGNSGATYRRDFIELENRGSTPVDVTGWTIQYHAATTTTANWAATGLTGVIPPGGLYLIAQAQGTGGTEDLPSPEVTGTIAMSATAGIVALVNTSTVLACGQACLGDAIIVDLVGYGNALTFEGTAAAPGLSNTTSAHRTTAPDTDTNAADFISAAPTPRVPGEDPEEPEECPTTPPAARIHDLQGDGWLSPYDNLEVTHVPGVVTAVRSVGSSRGFWIQDIEPDANPATSEGLFVFTGSAGTTVQAGDAVVVSGLVRSWYLVPSGETFATASTIAFTEITGGPEVIVCASDQPVPAPEVITAETLPDTYAPLTPTGNVEDLVPVDPTRSVLDFWRSRQGMRVQVNDVRVVGPGNEFGEVYVTVKPDEYASARGGTVNTGYENTPTGRVVIFPVTGEVPQANVGDVLAGATIGPVDYIVFGGFSIAATVVGGHVDNGLTRQAAAAGETDQLSVATYNVENLAGTDPQAKYDALAQGIVTNLAAPDIVTLEEIQDNNGTTNDGTVDPTTTLDRFVAAIVAAGGPAYQWRQISPTDGEDGGAPGGNIRVAFLFNPARVTFVDRPGGDATTAVAVTEDADGTAALTLSPGRVDPTNVAWDNSRKPLAGEFVFQGAKVIVVANHFNSKGGDQNADGRFQPPTRSSEVQRMQQAATLRAFTDGVLAVDPQANIVVAGDLNDYQFSPVVQTLTAGSTGLTALIDTLPVTERYTYVFNGISQVLDHILVSPALSDVEYEVVHINAEFSDQASDHDPQVARLRPAPPGPVCTQTITGWHLGAVTVTTGTLCLQDATQVGPVTVRPGASLVVTQTTVIGPVRATGAATVLLCGSAVVGPVDVSGSTGPVQLGGAQCAANDVTGPVRVNGNTGGAVISGNRVIGVLACAGNVPAPTNEGVPNQVIGVRTGQCRDL